MDEKSNQSCHIAYTANEISFVNITPTERAEQISSYAAKNEMPDSGLTYIDWLLWYMLRDIYAEFRQGTLDKERGAARKKHAIEIWEKETFRDEQTRQTAMRVADLWKRVEVAASQYRKDRTLENADLLMVAIYGGLMRKESSEQAGQNGNVNGSYEQSGKTGKLNDSLVNSSQDSVKGGGPS